MPLPLLEVKILKRQSLLAIAENAVKGGDNYLFRNLYAKVNGKESDILEDGANSCAVFVTWILLGLELIKHPHSSVVSTEKDMVESGWHEVKELKPGAIVTWEESDANLLGEYKARTGHIGFYVGNNEAISNDSRGTKFPRKHDLSFNGTRRVEKIYWHPALDEE